MEHVLGSQSLALLLLFLFLLINPTATVILKRFFRLFRLEIVLMFHRIVYMNRVRIIFGPIQGVCIMVLPFIRHLFQMWEW